MVNRLRVNVIAMLALALALFCAPGLALADDELAALPEPEAAVLAEGGDQVEEVLGEEALDSADEAEEEAGDSAEVAVDDAASGEQVADADADAAVADDAADEAVADVAEDAAVEEDASEAAAAFEEPAPAEAPMVLMAAKSSVAAAQGHWEVTASRGHGLQRYWIEADGTVAKNRLIDPAEGSGWWAYARPEGYVVRGKYAAKDGKVYLANNDGKLENPGWLVTAKYDGGLQRYYIDEAAHAAIPGYSSKGWVHYTLPNKGYVARGAFTDSNGRKMTADNDGRVKGGIPKAYNGWVVTNAFGHGLQRYWFRNDVMVKSELLDAAETGWWAYARPEGYVVRGKYAAKDGKVYLANNDGKLENPGWVVTKAYDGGYQRYWIDSNAHAAVPGHVEVAGEHYYSRPSVGYVLRGKLRMGGGMLLADNDGKLAWQEGWLVTNKYDGGMQRYRIDGAPGSGLMGAHLGDFSIGGDSYYGRPDTGYVVRGAYISPARKLYYANNDGVLRKTISGDKVLDSYIEKIIVNITGVGGDALRKGFDYVAGYKFKNQNNYPGNTTDWSVGYAKEMYENGIGNCYRYASLMRWIAQGLGYDAGVYSGSEPYYDGRHVAHGWTTIKQNGRTYIIDCENEYERKLRNLNHNWFMVTYKQAPVRYLTEDGKRALEDFVV